MARQLRLSLNWAAAFTRETFVVGPSNSAAVALLDGWPRWPGGCLVLVGAEGVGKSHLAMTWATSAKAEILQSPMPEAAAAAGRPALLEDVDQGCDDERLFHLINQAARDGASLLLTARTRPAAWPCVLPDLRSRLNALAVAEIAEPDDEVLRGVLTSFFRERNIKPHDDVYPYILRRMERSISAAREIVRRMDETEDAEIRPVSRVLARQILETEIENFDLFDG